MNKIYDIKEAAQALRISPWTVRAYLRVGRLRPVRIGRRVLLEESELERLVTEGKDPATVPAEASLTRG